MIRNTATLILVLLLALPAWAGRVDVEQTRDVDPDGEVSLELIAGSVEIVGWSRNQVRVTGSIDSREHLDVDSHGGDVSISVEVPEGKYRNSQGAELEIRVPQGTELQIEAISADVEIRDVTGAASVEVISGHIDVRGDIEELELSCISGNIEVTSTRSLRRGSFETVSGSIDFRGAVGSRGRLNFESVNGNVTLRLPSNTSAEIDAETFNGDIRTDFGRDPERTSKYLPGKQLSLTLGSGDARVTVESFNGTVRLIEE